MVKNAQREKKCRKKTCSNSNALNEGKKVQIQFSITLITSSYLQMTMISRKQDSFQLQKKINNLFPLTLSLSACIEIKLPNFLLWIWIRINTFITKYTYVTNGQQIEEEEEMKRHKMCAL